MGEKMNQTWNNGTTKNQENQVCNYVSTYGKLTVSETARGIFARMDQNTPENELLIRGGE